MNNINKNKNNVAGYMFNGSSSFSVMPIVCSMKGIYPVDDYFCVFVCNKTYRR